MAEASVDVADARIPQLSGQATEEALARRQGLQLEGVMQKPFSLAELAGMVRKVLGARRQPAARCGPSASPPRGALLRWKAAAGDRGGRCGGFRLARERR